MIESKSGWGPLSFDEMQRRGIPFEEFLKLIDHWLIRMEKYQSELELAVRVLNRDPELTVEQIITGAGVLKRESENHSEANSEKPLPPSGDPSGK